MLELLLGDGIDKDAIAQAKAIGAVALDAPGEAVVLRAGAKQATDQIAEHPADGGADAGQDRRAKGRTDATRCGLPDIAGQQAGQDGAADAEDVGQRAEAAEGGAAVPESAGGGGNLP